MAQVSHSSTQGSDWSIYTTPQREPTPLIEASTAGIIQTVTKDLKDTNVNTHTDQKTEIGSWSVSMTNNRSSVTTLQISTASAEALVATSDNSKAHFTQTAISKKEGTSIQQLSLPLSTQTHSLIVTYKTESPNPVTVSYNSESVSLLQSLSSLGHELFSRTASLPRSRSDISAMTCITTTSEMVISNSAYEVTAKTSISPQNSLTVGSNSNLRCLREGGATTTVKYTVTTSLTKTVATATWSSSSSSSPSSITTLSLDSVVISESSLHSKSQIITGRSASDYRDWQTDNISIHTSSSIFLDSTVRLKFASLTSMRSHFSKSVPSQSTPRGSNTLLSNQEDRLSSEMHVTIATTDRPGGVSETQTAGDNFTNVMSLQTTITLGSLTKTILPSFHTKGSKKLLFVTPMVGQTSTFLLPSRGNGSFDVSSLPRFTKGSESLQTYPRTVAFSMSVTTSTPKAELNTSYNMSAASETLDLAQTLKLPNNFSRKSVSTSHGNTTTSFALNITSLTHTINSSGVLSIIHPTRSSVTVFSTMESSLPPASFIPTITYSVTKTSSISEIYHATDVFSEVYVTVTSNITTAVSSLPNILNKTSVLEIIPSSDMLLTTDVSSEVHATRVSTSIITSFQTFTPESILAEPKTSRKLFSSSNASGNIVASIYQTEKEITSGSPTLSMESRSRLIKDSVGESSVEDASKKLPSTQHISATSSIQEATVRINTSKIRTVGSNLDSSLDTFTPGSISIIKSTMFQTSDGVSPYPFTPSLTESLFSVKASNTSTSFATSTAGSGSRVHSQTLAHASSSLSFIVSSGVSETSVLTTQKPSQIVSVTMQDKSSTHPSVITVPSPSTDRNLSSAAGLPSTSNTKQQPTSRVLSSALTSLVDTLPWKTSTIQNTDDNSKASPNETFSRANVSLYSTHHSLQLVSTSMTKEIMFSNSSLNTHQLSTTALPQSTRLLTSKAVNLTQGFTSVPSSMHSKPAGYVTHTRAISTTLTSSSASSRDGEITEVNTVESSVFATSSHAIITTEQPFGSVSTNTIPGYSIWTSFSKTKGTLDSIQTQSSIPSQEIPPFTSRTTSSIGPDTTKKFGTATIALVATVSVSKQTEPPPVSPKQFDVTMILQMTWESHYEYSYTPEFQALASKVKTQLTTVLKTLDGFLSVLVLRFWKSSVGVDFVVFVEKSAQVSENTVERRLIEANNTGVLDLPLTSIQVQEGETSTTTTLLATQPTNEDKSIERWLIILIVAGILVFLMSLIICSLAVSKL